MVKVLYFGAAREMAGKATEEFTAGDTASLRRMILEKYPRMRNLPFRIALNRICSRKNASLKENDIIAILPPFEGG